MIGTTPWSETILSILFGAFLLWLGDWMILGWIFHFSIDVVNIVFWVIIGLAVAVKLLDVLTAKKPTPEKANGAGEVSGVRRT